MIVGREWLMRRTRQMAEMVFEPRVMEGAEQLVNALDRYCSENDIDPSRIQLGDAKFIKGLQYIEYPLQRQ